MVAGDIMQRIKNVMIKDLQGQEVKDLTSIKAFIMTLGQAIAADPDSAIAMYALGQKLMASSGDVLVLEDAEFKVLQKAVRDNARGFVAVVWAQLLQLLESAENA